MENERLIADFLQNGFWYHSIKVNQVLKSNGTFDHAGYISKYGFPDSLRGKDVLDVGCADGFFSFEFEKREASSVLAVDINRFDGSPAVSPSVRASEKFLKKYEDIHNRNITFMELAKKLGLKHVNNFLIAKKLINSNVKFKYFSVYDLEKLGRKFDLVFCGDLIEHLKNPIQAAEQLAKVCGNLCIISLSNPIKYSSVLNVIPGLKNRLLAYYGDFGGTFFHFHPSTFKQLLIDCGFREVEIYSSFKILNRRYNYKSARVIYHCKV